MKEPSNVIPLARLYDDEPVPERHSESTPECPSLLRFHFCRHGGWTPQERRHVSSCAYCQKTTAQAWIEGPPSLAQIAQYVLHPGSFPDGPAMEQYFGWVGERTPQLVKQMLAARGLLDAGREALAGALGSTCALFGSLPLPSLALASAADAVEPGVLVELDDPERGVQFGLRTNAQEQMEIFLRPGAGARARLFQIAVYGGPRTLRAELPTGPGESIAVLGPAEALLAELGPECLVVLEEKASVQP